MFMPESPRDVVDPAPPPWLRRWLRSAIGTDATAMHAIKANVVRLLLDDGTSVIVKQSRAKLPGRPSVDGWAPEFVAEAATYDFLDAIGFTLAPRRLAVGPGLLVLEDLGPRTAAHDDAIGPAVMATLAELHRAAAGRGDEHRALLEAAGWGRDERMYSEEQYARLFAIGRAVLVDLAHDGNRVGDLLNHARAHLAASAVPPTLLHDDVLVARQFVLRDGRCHLLDWEMAKYGHPALDVARTLVGKLDRLAGTRTYAARHLGLDRPVTELHRDRLGVDPSVWDRDLDAAIVLRSVANLGAQRCVVGDEVAAEGYVSTRSAIVDRMVELLTPALADRLRPMLRGG